MIIKNYYNFVKEKIEMLEFDFNILESIVTDSESLLKSINAEMVLMGDVLDFNSENFTDIDVLSKDTNFIKKLDKKGLKKNNIEYSKDCETFLKDTIDIKFFLIFKKDDSELDNPEYIVFQNRKGGGRWNQIKMYKVKENIRKFYDTLSSKTIEIKRGDKNYIFRTSNAGNDWTLQNIQNKDEDFKNVMSDDELRIQINKKGTLMNIIS
mgnify:CR=1 FL=1